MVHQVAAALAHFTLGVVHGEGLGRLVHLFGGSGEADQVVREGAGEFAHHFGRVALGIDGDEDRLHLRRQLRVLLLEAGIALHHPLHVEGADVGAIGIAEVDDPVLAVEIAPADGIAAAVDQLERTADRCAGKRRLGGVLGVAGGEENGKNQRDEVSKHDKGVHALLTRQQQGGESVEGRAVRRNSGG